MKVITANLNGIRSSRDKGFLTWASEQQADFICVQETKAQMHVLGHEGFAIQGMSGYYADAERKGYSGVGVYARQQPLTVHRSCLDPVADQEGRYLALEYDDLVVASLYLPSGTSGAIRQTYKMSLLAHLDETLLSKKSATQGKPMIICGDWNIAHQPIDLKNWRQNQKNSGFLPEERAWLDALFQRGWVDAFRVVHPELADQYTWWTYRGQARQKNVGWRIDYQIVSQALKTHVKSATIVPTPVFSDHAPLVMEYDYAYT